MKPVNIATVVFALGLLICVDRETALVVCRAGLALCAIVYVIDHLRDYQIRKLRIEAENKKASQ